MFFVTIRSQSTPMFLLHTISIFKIIALFQTDALRDEVLDNPAHSQQLLLENAILHLDYDYQHFIHAYFRFEAVERHNVCKWPGVQCDNGVVRYFVLTSVPEGRPVLQIDWLPPTTYCIHLDDVKLRTGISTERLPRALRYFFAIDCGLLHEGANDFKVNFRKLPHELEEFYVLYGWLHGVVDLQRLPPKMRVIHLAHTSINTVYVDWDKAPLSMKMLSVSNLKFLQTKVVQIGDAAPRAHVLQRWTSLNMHWSNYIQNVKAVMRDAMAVNPNIAQITRRRMGV